MTAGLLRAEWIKLRRMRITWLVLLFPVAAGLCGAILPTLAAADAVRRFGARILQPLDTFTFPQSMLFGLQIVELLGSILIVVFITSAVGNEYGFDTWKNLLARHGRRGAFLLTKLLYALAAVTILIVIVPILVHLAMLLTFRAAAGFDFPQPAAPDGWQTFGGAWLLTWLRLAITASIGLFATVITRSGGAGVAIAVSWLVVDALANSLGTAFETSAWRSIAPFTFNFNLSALAAYLRGGAGDPSAEFILREAEGLRAGVTLLHSLLNLALYTLGLTALAMLVFRRRDVA